MLNDSNAEEVVMSIPRLGTSSMSDTSVLSVPDRMDTPPTKISFNTTDFVNGGPAGNTFVTQASSQHTIKYPGVYLISSGIHFANPANPWKVAISWVGITPFGGSIGYDYMTATTGANSTNTNLNNAFYYELGKGDIVALFVYQAQTPGAALNASGGGDIDFLELTLIDRL